MDNRRIQGWNFEYDEEHKMFECRGEVMYEDDHDQMPEPELWSAAVLLEKMLNSEGHKAEANHSEKGWVEVTINN